MIAGLRRRLRSLDAEDGSAALELCLCIPLLVAILFAIISFGRLTDARIQVQDAAHQAARAASIARASGAATTTAEADARTAMAGSTITCTDLTVSVTGDLTPGGVVTARVDCTVSLAHVALPGMPGHRTIGAEFTSEVDQFRSESGS